jgi:heme-NO-binding protein
LKGVFNLLEEVVSRHYGADIWDDLLSEAGVSSSYTSLGNYPDAEIEALVRAASDKLGTDRTAVLRWFGQSAMPVLAERYPAFFTRHASSRPFVLGINHVIHAEVRKLYTGAECPHFHLRQPADGALHMEYRSSRQLCALAQGFVEGAAAVYNEAVSFEHLSCRERGDPRCAFKIVWLAERPDAG